ncbi:hypothetical protein [Endozoicomonas sp. OPT23]|uniref:hypothetical protein n=1 Tax=Endozoicomonas sp. OPT23 TaxID=2072845 RepID=UPI00129AAEEF|nr:hypothetical protein [Endozoicomonas sp. OPT23]
MNSNVVIPAIVFVANIFLCIFLGPISLVTFMVGGGLIGTTIVQRRRTAADNVVALTKLALLRNIGLALSFSYTFVFVLVLGMQVN